MATPPFSGFHVTAVDARGEIVLDRGDELNPLSTQTLLDLERAARWFDTQPDVRTVVVRGEGRAFCAGADLVSFAPSGLGELPPHEAADAGRRMADALEAMRAITVARIHGHCVGGGLVLAAVCDFRIASDDTRFAIPEVDLGIPLAWGGIHRLVREIGPTRTKELVMTCRPFSAHEAHAMGFLNSVVPEDELDVAVSEMVARLESKPFYPLWSTKRSVNAVAGQMVALGTSVDDTDALLNGLRDPECRAAADRYIQDHRRR